MELAASRFHSAGLFHFPSLGLLLLSLLTPLSILAPIPFGFFSGRISLEKKVPSRALSQYLLSQAVQRFVWSSCGWPFGSHDSKIVWMTFYGCSPTITHTWQHSAGNSGC